MSEASEADDFLDSLGLSSGDVTSDDKLYNLLSDGVCPKIDNLKYWLRGEMGKLEFLHEENVAVTKNVLAQGKNFARGLTKNDWAALFIKYYLQMYHLPWFHGDFGGAPCSYQEMVRRIMLRPDIAEIIEKS